MQTRNWSYVQLGPAHTNHNHLPFNHLNKSAFKYKFFSYMGVGFALPFIAIGWQWYKPGGYKASTA
ncbi:hypothetical protein CYLTODRAFT_427389 [Cylindrobasidium torrendii FP15055 ss-10]|uniref:Cytochrome c oxidase subunit 8, mitochondrial n=1 Tax=Cylindrobasidium torrendii FP15055 ss-10 TaxID=1314674 RepID=A0A0D7ATN6_9AGAR|nr:hypothetical protein CYLTODRAFT_427389 [Cylindrobasidium torrendii FP15055 ss-10]